jgi:hypothetical protein
MAQSEDEQGFAGPNDDSRSWMNAGNRGEQFLSSITAGMHQAVPSTIDAMSGHDEIATNWSNSNLQPMPFSVTESSQICFKVK